MLRVRYLLCIGLIIYSLDLYTLKSEALELPNLFGSDEDEKKEKDESGKKESSKEAFYRMAYHDKSRETESGETLQYAYNPYCSWLRIFGDAGLQSNCLLNAIVGPYRIFKKYYKIAEAFI